MEILNTPGFLAGSSYLPIVRFSPITMAITQPRVFERSVSSALHRIPPINRRSTTLLSDTNKYPVSRDEYGKACIRASRIISRRKFDDTFHRPSDDHMDLGKKLVRNCRLRKFLTIDQDKVPRIEALVVRNMHGGGFTFENFGPKT